MRHCGTDPLRLHLKITEGSAMTEREEAVAERKALRVLGLGFVIDNFGTDVSPLVRLLPVEAIKFDWSFVRGSSTDPNDAARVETIIVMARHLGPDVIAEGCRTTLPWPSSPNAAATSYRATTSADPWTSNPCGWRWRGGQLTLEMPQTPRQPHGQWKRINRVSED
jgi:predicted signal transduction protein with EAL and GGDEF domain